MIEFTLPWPPSVNRYWRTYQGRMLISEEGRAYRLRVEAQVFVQRARKNLKGALKVEIEAWRPDKRKRDLDNLLKATLDAMSHAGVYADDSQITDLRIYWAENIGGMLKVKVSEV